MFTATDATLVLDEELVIRIRNHDFVAFETIIRRHNGRLYRLAKSVLRNDAEAEDVVQETYMRDYTKFDDFVGSGEFSV